MQLLLLAVAAWAAAPRPAPRVTPRLSPPPAAASAAGVRLTPAGKPSLPPSATPAPGVNPAAAPGAHSVPDAAREDSLPLAEFSGPWSDPRTDQREALLDKVFDGRSKPRLLGEAGPGVTAAHLAGMQRLADELGAPVFAHGSRQTGRSAHTGKPFRPSSDLDLGVVGDADTLLSSHGAAWRQVADALHAPMFVATDVPEALARGFAVVLPRGRRVRKVDPALLEQAEDWATRKQLTKLAAKPRGETETFRFALIGDAEPGRFWFSRLLWNRPGVFRRLLAEANGASVDFILQLGDMVSRGTPGRFRRFLAELEAAALDKPYLTVIGNHDRRKPHGVTDSSLYRSLFGGTNYWLDRGAYRIIVVDSSAGRVTRNQLRWLEAALDTPRRKIVVTHVPPAPLPWTSRGLGGFKRGAAEFMDLMAEAKVERVYMGHVHGFASHDDRGVRYVLTGGGGSPLFPAPVQRREHHWLEVAAGPDGVAETYHALDKKGEALP